MRSLISIIMPIHNGERFLEQCISSILTQSFKDFELICVLNGSTDCSKEIIESKSINDERIKVLEFNKGNAGFARNKGMEIATGNYILFLDCDDYFEPQFLELLYNKAESNKADITICDVYIYNEKNHNNTRNKLYLNDKILNHSECIKPSDINKSICQISLTVVWNKLYKTDFIKHLNLKFQEISSCNDMYFSIVSLVSAKNIAFVYIPLLHYRINHSSSITNKSKKNYSDILYVIKSLMIFMQSNEEMIKYKESFMSLFIFHIIAHYIKLKSYNERVLMIEEFKRVGLNIQDFYGFKTLKPSFNYIFQQIFIKSKNTLLSKLLCKSRLFRFAFDFRIC